ncbi:MAG: hemolysin III family protein [Myxococcales bacterium]|nr:hemolysin III family protein [Myxococcales bacterium]
MTTAVNELEKPRLRGVSHLVSFFVALAAGAVLIALVPAQVRAGLAIYTASLCTMFGVSAAYHRPTWSPGARRWMRRLDHAAIFVLIAGTGTPFALLLPERDGKKMLALLWIGAAVGVVRAVVWIGAPKVLVALLALAMAWASVPFFSTLVAHLGAGTFGWIAAGGVLYTLGALAYATKRPNPWPRTFGYHEVFHALVVAGAVCHFVAVTRAVA